MLPLKRRDTYTAIRTSSEIRNRGRFIEGLQDWYHGWALCAYAMLQQGGWVQYSSHITMGTARGFPVPVHIQMRGSFLSTELHELAPCLFSLWEGESVENAEPMPAEITWLFLYPQSKLFMFITTDRGKDSEKMAVWSYKSSKLEGLNRFHVKGKYIVPYNVFISMDKYFVICKVLMVFVQTSKIVYF